MSFVRAITVTVAVEPTRLDLPSQKRMSFWEHLDELRERSKILIGVFVALFIVFMTCTLTTVPVGSYHMPMLVPTIGNNVSAVSSQFFRATVDFLKPPWVLLAAKTPWDGALAQIKVAAFLALAVEMPLIAYQMNGFVGPALKPSEKRLIRQALIPVVLLFFAGAALDYLVLLPFTINLLYSIQRGMGAQIYLLYMDDFITFVVVHVLAFGLAFQLPLVMYATSATGLVKAQTWVRHWRIITAAIWILAAIITPDPTGITMILVGTILMGLYAGGYLLAKRADRKRASMP